MHIVVRHNFLLKICPTLPRTVVLRLAQVPRTCAPSRIRTYDLILKRDLLYQLSYERIGENLTQKAISHKFLFGARGGNRTHTVLRPGDFKSPMYTNFITRAGRPRWESNPRIEILQISELPLFYVALGAILLLLRQSVNLANQLLTLINFKGKEWSFAITNLFHNESSKFTNIARQEIHYRILLVLG